MDLFLGSLFWFIYLFVSFSLTPYCLDLVSLYFKSWGRIVIVQLCYSPSILFRLFCIFACPYKLYNQFNWVCIESKHQIGKKWYFDNIESTYSHPWTWDVSIYFFKLFYCCSITVVCISSAPLYLTSAKSASLPCYHPPHWFRTCVLYTTSWKPFSLHSLPPFPLTIVRLFLI